MTDSYLSTYQDYLKAQGLKRHFAENKLRDTEDRFVDDGHSFSWNGEILYSYDVCGNCEAHAILLDMGKSLTNVNTSRLLKDIPPSMRSKNFDLFKCP